MVVDLCKLKGRYFLVVVDYFLRFIEIVYLDILVSVIVIWKMKYIGILVRWGIFEEFVIDNGI